MVCWRQVRDPFAFFLLPRSSQSSSSEQNTWYQTCVKRSELAAHLFQLCRNTNFSILLNYQTIMILFLPFMDKTIFFRHWISLQWRVVSLQYVHPHQESRIVWTGKSAWTFSSILTASMERNDKCASGFWMNNIYSRWSLFRPLTTPYQLCTFWLHGRLLCF